MTLTPEVARLVDDLRSPDPAVRDQGAYGSLARLADEGRLDDHLVELGDRAVALLGDGAVQARSFGALLLALVAARDNDTGRADDASVRGWLAAFLGWYAAEPDTRGHDEELGWLHAVAHGADAAGELAGSPRLDADDLAALLAALVDRTVAPTSTHWLQAEDDRVAYAVMAVLQRDLVDAAEVRRQVDRLAAAWLDAPGPLPPATDNATRLAHALRLQLATGVRYSDDGELLRPAAGREVEAALTAALAARHPFLDGRATPPGADPLEQLHALAADRERRGMRRVLRPRSLDDDVLDLASNDYLGLARDPRVAGAAAEAARRWGAGSTGSRLVTGSTDLHTRLEADLAGFVGTEAGLVFSSGYLANLGVLTALAGPGALVVSDALNHASVVDACRLSRAAVEVVPHRDVAAVGRVLARRTPGPAVVVTDAVFSVDGDLAPLAELHAVARRHGALLVVDEAHALGVVGDEGRGAAPAAGLAGQPDVVLTVTLSKSLGAQGGAVLGPAVVVEHLVNTARPFIFDTGLAPAAVAGAAAALEVLRAEPALAKVVRSRAAGLSADLLAAGLRATAPAAAVVSVLVGDPGPAADAASRLLALGVRVACFRPPSVPDGVSRLRLTARADLTDAEAARAVAAVAGAVRP